MLALHQFAAIVEAAVQCRVDDLSASLNVVLTGCCCDSGLMRVSADYFQSLADAFGPIVACSLQKVYECGALQTYAATSDRRLAFSNWYHAFVVVDKGASRLREQNLPAAFLYTGIKILHDLFSEDSCALTLENDVSCYVSSLNVCSRDNLWSIPVNAQRVFGPPIMKPCVLSAPPGKRTVFGQLSNRVPSVHELCAAVYNMQVFYSPNTV